MKIFLDHGLTFADGQTDRVDQLVNPALHDVHEVILLKHSILCLSDCYFTAVHSVVIYPIATTLDRGCKGHTIEVEAI